MTAEALAAPNTPRRSHRIGKKFLVGYLPCTALAVAAVFALVAASASWEALLAGGLLSLMWSAQITCTNLLILLVRYDSRFLVKAVLVTVLSIVLIPTIGVVQHQVELISMGKPNLAKYLQENSAENCTVVRILKEERYTNSGIAIRATVQCGVARIEKSCEWSFHYQKEKGVWAYPLSASGLYCQ